MQHRKSGRRFNRNTSHRRAMFRNLVGNLVLHEKIETTDAKAKELRRYAEKMLSKALRLGNDLTVDLAKLKEEERESVMSRRVAARRIVAKDLPLYGERTLKDGNLEQVDLVKKLFDDIAPRYLKRVTEGKGGGYTRITKLLARRGDASPMAIIEFVEGTN